MKTMNSAMSRCSSVRVCASTKNNVIVKRAQFLRKKYETIRAPVVRENVTKISIIASNDIKFITDMFHEIDQFHRDVFNSLKPQDSTKSPVSQESVEALDKIEDDGENIFK
jgi:hypothetical protein